MIKGTFTVEFRFTIGDGTNFGTYSHTISFDDITLKETEYYGAKIFTVLPPKNDLTVTLSKVATKGGSPPATVDVMFKADGSVIVTTTGYFFAVFAGVCTFTIDTIDDEAKISSELQTLVLAPVEAEEGELYLNVRDTSSNWVKPTLAAGYTDALVMASVDDGYVAGTAPGQDSIIGAIDEDFDINEPTEAVEWLVHVHDENKASVNARVSMFDAMLISAPIMDTDYQEGALVEKTITSGLALLNILRGDFSTVIGAIQEYSKDGKFGDLDIPGIQWGRRVYGA
jgi:hypothetical protein